MTVATLTLTELWRRGDPDLTGFLSLWRAHREPPVPFADWLTERDYPDAARVVGWVLGGKPQRVYRSCRTQYDGPSLPFPLMLPPENVIQEDCVWSWVALNGSGDHFLRDQYHRPDRIDWLRTNMAGRAFADFPTCEEALLYLLDQGADCP